MEFHKDIRNLVLSTRNIRDFSYSGSFPSWEDFQGRKSTWAIFYSVHRDSDLLTQSNFRSLEKIFDEKFLEQENHTTIHCGHFAYGWVDHLIVKCFEDGDLQNPTKEGILVEEWIENLEQYPIVNEHDFSDLESEEKQNCLEQCLSRFALSEKEEEKFWLEYQRRIDSGQFLEECDETGWIYNVEEQIEDIIDILGLGEENGE